MVSDEPTDVSIAPPVRRRHRWLAVGILLLGGMIICVLIGKFAFDWPASPDSVPWEVQQAADNRPDLIGRADVYDFWGNFIDSEHLWRVEVSPKLIPVLVRNCNVVELESAQTVPNAFWRQWPYWWHPPRNAPARFFASPGFPIKERGPDGQFFLMVYDEADGVLYVWHKNNF